jgi:spore coat protein U-like protein
MFLTRAGTRMTATAALTGLLSTLGLSAPLPVHAANTTDWACRVRADAAAPLTLKPADLARPAVDRRVYDLDCTFAATMPGPSPVTVCVSAPSDGGGRGLTRVLRRAGGKETIDYRLRAEAGSVPGALPSPAGDVPMTLQSVYTVPIGGADAGAGTIRHQLALVAELEALPGRFLAEGEYGETISGIAISIHDGVGCGPLLWGPPDDSLGPFADYALTARLPATCSINVVEPIQFGILEDFSRDQIKSGALGVRCSPGAGYSVELGEGNNAASGTRRMTGDAASGSPNSVLSYELLKSDGGRWSGKGSTIAGDALAGTGTGVLDVLPVTARVPSGSPPLPGTYRDAVIATLVY